MENDKNIEQPFFDYCKDMFSNEAYFGQNAPLAMILDSYSEELINFFKGPTKDLPDFKDKNVMQELEDLCNRFGKALAAELNMEDVKFGIDPDFKVNACAYPMFFYCDGVSAKQNGKSKRKYIDIDKYIDLEDIIQTKTGFKFKNSKGKIGCIICNLGTIKTVGSPRELSGILCHEIGHMMQHGVFGTMKCYADYLTARDLETLNIRFNIHEKSILGKLTRDKEQLGKLNGFSAFLLGMLGYTLDIMLSSVIMIPLHIQEYLISFVFFPNILDLGIFAVLNKKFKNYIGRMSDEKKYKLKDKLDKIEQNNEKEIATKIYNNWNPFKSVTNYPAEKRKEVLEKEINDKKKKFNKLTTFEDNPSPSDIKLEEKLKKNFGVSIIRRLAPITDTMYSMERQIVDLLTLNHYSKHYINDSFFLRKYENFADIFSSSYGYGLEMVKFAHKNHKQALSQIDEMYDHTLLFKIPLVSVIGKSVKYNEFREACLLDEHGSYDQRVAAIYTAYVHEIETNEDLTPAQKKELLKSIELIKVADESFYDSVKYNGFCMKFYNKLIDHRIKGTDKTVEEKILKPMEEICKEDLSKKRK